MTDFSLTSLHNFRATRFFDPRSATHHTAVAVSACLSGENVRYDGANKLLPVYSLLQRELNLIAVCPEIGAGMGVPRPPVHLIEINGLTRAVGRENPMLDVTSALKNFAAFSLRQLLDEHLLCGYIWKSRSPSCGFGSTPLFTAGGIDVGRTSGVQAEYFQRHLPYLNYCEETALETIDAVSNFVLRCRLVFDLLYASAATPHTLHRHYTFVHENFDASIGGKLTAPSASNNKTNYVATFLEGCNQMPEGALLQLFE